MDISTILEFSFHTDLEFGWKLRHVSKSRHSDTTISLHPLTFDEPIRTLVLRARHGGARSVVPARHTHDVAIVVGARQGIQQPQPGNINVARPELRFVAPGPRFNGLGTCGRGRRSGQPEPVNGPPNCQANRRLMTRGPYPFPPDGVCPASARSCRGLPRRM